MKQKRKLGRKLLSFLLALVMVLGLMPGMGLTAYATTPTETLLTTITGAGSNASTATSANVSYSTEGVATLIFSGAVSYQATPAWGWWGYGWSATVNAAEGYNITKCIFYDDANRTATDSEAPFVVETTEEDKTPKVNGTTINSLSKGIKKIEVYGYATPAHTHSFTYSADGATITATCTAAGCDLPPSTEGGTDHVAKLSLVAPTLTTYGGTGDATATLDGVAAFNTATGKTIATTDIKYVGRGSTTYAESSTAPTNAGTYTAKITVEEKTASLNYEIAKADPTANAPTGLTATYGQTLSDVTLTNPTGNTDGTWAWVAAGTTSVGNAGDNTFKANFTPTDANYKTVENVDVTITVGKAANPATVTGTATVIKGGNTVDLSGNVTMNGATGDVGYTFGGEAEGCTLSGSVLTSGNSTGTVTVNVTVAADSNYEALAATPITVTVNDKQTQTITAENVTANYGDTGKKIEASTTGDGGLSYAVKSGDAVTVDASGNLTIVKAGSAVITVTAAETDTYAQATKDVNVTVNTKAMTVSAEDVNVTVDGQAHGITVTVTDPASGATVKYGTEAGSYTLDASPTQTEVGEKTVYYQVTADNYTTYTGSAKVTITALPTYEVIYKVVNGTWSDDSTTDKKETVQSGSKPASVPTGMKAASGYTGGAWDTDPAGATITEATTFTYTFTAIPIYTVTVTNDGHGTGSAAPVSGAEGTEVTLNATPAEGYAFKEWQVVSGSVTVKDNKFTIGTANVEIKAVFEQAGDMEDEVIVEPGAPAVSGTNIDEVAAGVVTADEVAAGVKVWVDISPLAEAAVPAGDKALANQAMQGFGGTAGAWIDMSMFKQVAGQSKTAVHQTATAFRFSMKVPDSLKKAGRTFWLLRLHDDKADILATTTGDTLSGETDLFSTYLIAYKDAETPTPTPKPVPKTGDKDHPGLWILLMLIGIAGLTVIGTLKVSRKRK